MGGRMRYANQAHKVPVTDGHETEAKRAQLLKPPNRLGLFVLRMLGFRGEVTPPAAGPEGHAGPSHHHPTGHEHPTNTK